MLRTIPKQPHHQLNRDDVRIISKDIFYVTGDTSIYNSVYAVSYWKHGEVIGVEVENEELVKMYKSIFELLWVMGDNLEKVEL